MRLLIFLLIRLSRPFTKSIHALQDSIRRQGKAQWPVTQGAIHSCLTDRRENLRIVNILHSYSAEGEYWSGEFARSFVTEKDSAQYESLHKKGSPVMVRYCPGKPQKSVLLKEDQFAISPVVHL